MSSAIIGEASLNKDSKLALDDFILCLRHLRFSSVRISA
jgi:hypothetical protein